MPDLELYLHDQRVGIITPDRDRSRVRLAIDADYDPDAGVLLSEAFTTLPRTRPPIEAVTNFLGGYVPEGNHREHMAAKRHVDQNDLFALLNEFGGSIAGAVTLRRSEENTQPPTPTYQPVDDRELEAMLKQAITDSDQGIPDDSRSTLPGFQPKVLVAVDGSGWAYPHGRAHSTWILKPQVLGRPERIFDEAYSHELSRRVGLSSYRSEIRRANRTTYLAIERFDREVVDGAVILRHQEDMAQGLSLDWRDAEVKFQDQKWPTDARRATVARIAELLGSIPGSAAALEQWVRQLAFHVTIGNNDAHAKNVALMHGPDGTELAQVYDAVPNLFQRDRIQWVMALAIDGHFDHRTMSTERILAEVTSWAVLEPGRASEVVEETLERLEDAIGSVQPPTGASVEMADRLQWNVTRLRAGKEISEPKH